MWVCVYVVCVFACGVYVYVYVCALLDMDSVLRVHIVNTWTLHMFSQQYFIPLLFVISHTTHIHTHTQMYMYIYMCVCGRWCSCEILACTCTHTHTHCMYMHMGISWDHCSLGCKQLWRPNYAVHVHAHTHKRTHTHIHTRLLYMYIRTYIGYSEG